MKNTFIHEPTKECPYKIAWIYNSKFEDNIFLKENIEQTIKIFPRYIELRNAMRDLQDERDETMFFSKEKRDIYKSISNLNYEILIIEKVFQDIDPYFWEICTTYGRNFYYNFFQKVHADYVFYLTEKDRWYDINMWFRERDIKKELEDR